MHAEETTKKGKREMRRYTIEDVSVGDIIAVPDYDRDGFYIYLVIDIHGDIISGIDVDGVYTYDNNIFVPDAQEFDAMDIAWINEDTSGEWREEAMLIASLYRNAEKLRNEADELFDKFIGRSEYYMSGYPDDLYEEHFGRHIYDCLPGYNGLTIDADPK